MNEQQNGGVCVAAEDRLGEALSYVTSCSNRRYLRRRAHALATTGRDAAGAKQERENRLHVKSGSTVTRHSRVGPAITFR